MPRRAGPVHVAKIVTTRNGREYVSYLLRRNYRDGATVRHETLGNISHLPPRLIDVVRRGLAGEEFLSTREAMQTTRSLPHGQVEAVLGTIRRLGLDSIIASRRCRERRSSSCSPRTRRKSSGERCGFNIGRSTTT